MANDFIPVAEVEQAFVPVEEVGTSMWDKVKKYASENYSDGPTGIEMGLPAAESQGLAEGLATTATGLGAWIPAGLNMASKVLPRPGQDWGPQLKDAAKESMDIQEALTYQPRTESGQAVAGALASPFTAMAEAGEKGGKFFDSLADKSREKGLSIDAEIYDVLGFLSRTGGEAAPFLLPIIPKLGKMAASKIAKSPEFLKAKEYASSLGSDVSRADAAMRERVLGKMPETEMVSPEGMVAEPGMPTMERPMERPMESTINESAPTAEQFNAMGKVEGGFAGERVAYPRDMVGDSMVSDIKGGSTHDVGKFAGMENDMSSVIGMGKATYDKGKVVLENSTPQQIQAIRDGDASINGRFAEIMAENEKAARIKEAMASQAAELTEARKSFNPIEEALPMETTGIELPSHDRTMRRRGVFDSEPVVEPGMPVDVPGEAMSAPTRKDFVPSKDGQWVDSRTGEVMTAEQAAFKMLGYTGKPDRFVYGWKRVKESGHKNDPQGRYADMVADNLLEWEQTMNKAVDPSQFELKKQWDMAVVKKMYEKETGEFTYDVKVLRKYLDDKVKNYSKPVEWIDQATDGKFDTVSGIAKIAGVRPGMVEKLTVDGLKSRMKRKYAREKTAHEESLLAESNEGNIRHISEIDSLTDAEKPSAMALARMEKEAFAKKRIREENKGRREELKEQGLYIKNIPKGFERDVTRNYQSAVSAFSDKNPNPAVVAGNLALKRIKEINAKEPWYDWDLDNPEHFGAYMKRVELDRQAKEDYAPVDGLSKKQWIDLYNSAPLKETPERWWNRSLKELKQNMADNSNKLARAERNLALARGEGNKAKAQIALEDAKAKLQRGFDEYAIFGRSKKPAQVALRSEMPTVDRVPLRPINEYGTGGIHNISPGKTRISPERSPEGVPMDATMNSIISDIKGGSTHDVGRFAGEGGSAINLSKLDTDIGVKRMMDAKAREMSAEIGRKPVSLDELWQQSKSMGLSAEEAIQLWNTNKSLTPEQLMAVRQLNLNAQQSLYQAVRDLPAHVTELPAAIKEQYSQAMALLKITSQAASEAGRALRVHGRVLEYAPGFEGAKAMQKAMKEVKDLTPEQFVNVVNKIKEIDPNDVTAIDRVVVEGTSSKAAKLGNAAHELLLNSLLSNPLTHNRNVLGNALQLTLSPVLKVIGGGFDAVSSRILGKERSVYASEGLAELASFQDATINGLRRMKDAWKNNDEMGSIDSMPSALPKWLADIMPLRALSAMDGYFKGAGETVELHAQAHRVAKREGLSGPEFINRKAELLADPTVEMLNDAVKNGKEVTYQQELPGFMKSLLKLKSSNPYGQLLFDFAIAPFVKTAFNITREGLRTSPVGFIETAFDVGKVRKGEMSHAEFATKVSKPILGTAIAITTAILASNDLISGSGPSNRLDRLELMQTGWQPNSIKIGDTWYSHRPLAHLSLMIGAVADIVQTVKEGNSPGEIATGTIEDIGANILDQTFLAGVSDLFNVLTDSKRYGESFIRNRLTMPVPAVLGGLARSDDEQFRDPRGIAQAFQAKIPGLSDNLPAKLTIWGEDMYKQNSGLERFINPFVRSQEIGSPIEREMRRMKEYHIGYPSRKINGVEVEGQAYWDMVRKARLPAKQLLDMAVGTNSWNRKSDEEKAAYIKKTILRFSDNARDKVRRQMQQDGRLVRNSVGHWVPAQR